MPHILTRQLLFVWLVTGAGCLAGCGGSNNIWITGELQKDGETYKPSEGHKLALYFHPIAGGSATNLATEVEMADYDQQSGSFTVPGRDGDGILPGKYRVVLVETLRREAFDQLKRTAKRKRGENRIDKETNFLEASFGEKASPFVCDLQTSSRLTLDIAKPTQYTAYPSLGTK